MAHDLSSAAREFRDLATNLRLVGEEGLRKELFQAIDEAAQPLAGEIGRVGHLRDYMPNRYADVLAADLRVSVHRRTTGEGAGVNLFANAPTFGRGGRKVRQRDEGRITHPVFGQGDRRSWRWKEQTAGMVPGFFTTPAERAAPQVRDKILEAMRRVADKATGRA